MIFPSVALASSFVSQLMPFHLGCPERSESSSAPLLWQPPHPPTQLGVFAHPGIQLAFPEHRDGAQQSWLERKLSAEIGQVVYVFHGFVNIVFLAPQEDKGHFGTAFGIVH